MMSPSDSQVADTLARLARGDFVADLDWPTCFDLVRQVVNRRNLPAREYAPSSRFGGADWTTEDYTELADEWIMFVRGGRASRLEGEGRASAHVANAVRQSIYHFVLDQALTTPGRELWAALKETLPEFPFLTTGARNPEPWIPNAPFPWKQVTVRSTRQRAVSAPEVRAALKIIQAQRPTRWTVQGLFETVASWAGLPEGYAEIREFHEAPTKEPTLGGADSAVIGREAARAILRKLDDEEKTLLRGFLIPNGLGMIGLEKAAAELGVKKSTLHDRAGRLQEKLASMEYTEVATMDVVACRAFLDEILSAEFGNLRAEPGTE